MHCFCFLKMLYLVLRWHQYCDLLTLIKLTFYSETTPYIFFPWVQTKLTFICVVLNLFSTFRNVKISDTYRTMSTLAPFLLHVINKFHIVPSQIPPFHFSIFLYSIKNIYYVCGLYLMLQVCVISYAILVLKLERNVFFYYYEQIYNFLYMFYTNHGIML